MTLARIGALGATAALALVVALAVPAQGPQKIRIGVHTALMGAPDVIAIRQGYFKDEGLDVDWRRFALGKEGRDAMIAGAIDVNATATTPFLIGVDKGVPFTAIAVNSLFCGINHIVVLKSSDITAVAQLRGKKVGLPKGTITEHVFVARIVPANGLKPGDVQIVNIPDAKDRTPSLVARAIDAAVSTDPFVAIAEQQGLIRSIEDYCKYDRLPFLVTATTKIVAERPDAVVAYLRGWLRAVRLLREEPGKAAAIYVDELKSLGRETSVAVMDRALRRMRWEPELTPELDRYLAEEATGLVASGQLRAVPDLARSENKELLRKAMAAR